MDFIQELTWRGMVHTVMPGTEEELKKGMTTAYLGIDPTADSLHIGHLCGVMMLRHFQRCGHKPLVLVGGATGMIGDPSGKSAERNLLDEKTLRHNQEAIKNQLRKFLDFDSDAPNRAEMVNNYDWTKDVTFLDFAREIGKHITVNYNAGVPTADCSYGGWIRMGANASYQAIGTVMHEMNHGVGVGQHTVWYGPDSPYRETGESGLWYGVRATELIRFLQNDETAMLHGDKTHMWPYGINGAHEDDHTEILYLANGLVTQAVGEDALPPVAGRFHTPAYTFPIDENIRYYLKVEDPESGAYSNYLVETDGNKIGWETLTASDATTDGHAAWYMAFDPVNCYYTLCNAATGNFLAMAKGARRAVVSAPEGSEAHLMRFQLTPSIKKVTVGDRSELTYWVTVAEAVDTPRALSINSNGEPAYIGYSMNAGSVARQRWHIVTEADLPAFEGEAGIAAVGQDSKSIFPADIYDICGRIVKHDALNLEGLTPGIYIVAARKFLVR